MSRLPPSRIPRLPSRFAAALLAIALLAAGAVAASSAAQHSKRVAAEGEVASLGKTVLTTTGGRTLYSLSVEKHGRFVCTASCLSTWHPLRVPQGVHPTGPVKLSTIDRPEGGIQVTYRGRPLYRFAGDSKAGQANGEGFKDVGTWHAAAVPAQTTSTPESEPQPAPPENPYPQGY